MAQTFLSGYIECALWSSPSNEDPNTGEPMLDAAHGEADIAPETLAAMRETCETFQRDHAADLGTAYATDGYTEARAGHDLWLTRNGHGAGFWDRGLGPVGDRLTDAAHALGECNLYVGDDGKIRTL